RTGPVNGQGSAVFQGLPAGDNLIDQLQYGRNLLGSAGIAAADVSVTQALDRSGSYLLQTPLDVTQWTLTAELQGVPGFVFVQDYEQPPADLATQRAPPPNRSAPVFVA